MSTIKLVGQDKGPNDTVAMLYRLTRWDGAKTETLPMIPNIMIPIRDKPTSKAKAMHDVNLWAWAFMYLEYDYDERQLQREAVDEILGLLFYGLGHVTNSKHWERLEHADDNVVTEVRRLAPEFKEIWKPCIDGWYHEAYNRIPLFKARHDYLPGLSGRLPIVKILSCDVDRPRELWEILIAYTIVNSSRKRDGSEFNEFQHQYILGHWWNVRYERTSITVKKFADHKHRDTQTIESVIFDFARTIADGADMVVNEYEEKKLKLPPRGAALQATTGSFAAMSLTATAPGPSSSTAPTSSQPAGAGASRLTVPDPETPGAFDDYIMRGAFDESDEPQTDADTDPRKKGKGRVRDSTSSPSGGDKSEKGKGKRPRTGK